MSYEEIKQSIYDYLISKGFTQHDDIFIKEDERVVQTMIINGQAQQRTQKYKFTLACLGEGWIQDSNHPTKEESEILIGWKLLNNDIDVGDFWFRDLEEFTNTIKL